MKSLLIVAALVAGAAAAWLFAGRLLVVLVDGFATEHVGPLRAGPFVYAPGTLSVGDTPLETSAPGGRPSDFRVDADAGGRLVLTAEGKTFALGARVGPAEKSGRPDFPFAPDPGDTVSLDVAHSVFAWPTPFDSNYLSGHTPSWRRNVYYTLTWRKRDGATLDMVWRYEQWFYGHDGWASPMMTDEGATGLVRVRIS